MFLFLLDSSIHLSYSDVSGMFVSKTFLFFFLLLFPLNLSNLHHIFSALFSLPPFHRSFLYFSKAPSLPYLVQFLQQFFLRVCFLISFFISSLTFIFCSLYLSQIKYFSLSLFSFLCCLFNSFLFLLVLSSIFLFLFCFCYFYLNFQGFFCCFFHYFIYCHYIYVFVFCQSILHFFIIVVHSSL